MTIQHWTNAATTQLNGGITSGAASLVVHGGDGALFPATGPFRIKIENEIIEVGSRSTDTFSSLTRGVDGTTAASHVDNAVVKGVLTAAQLGMFHQAGDPSLTDADVASANKDGTTGTSSLRTLGTGAQQAAAGNDSRLSDARTPTAHHTTHENGGSDQLALDAAQITTGTIAGGRLPLETGSTDVTSGHLVTANDTRLSDARTPTGHHASHEPGGSDALDLTAIHPRGSSLPTLPNASYPNGALFIKTTDGTLWQNQSGTWVQTGGSSYSLPIATTSVLGGIKPDGTTITVNGTTGVATATGGSGGGSSTLAGLSDVSESSPAQGQVLGYDGAHWVNVGGIQKIAETIVGVGGAASVTFPSIPGTYRNLTLIVTGRGDTAAAITPVHAQFNSDTAGHYDEQEYYNSNASTLTADAAQAQTRGYMGYIAAASDTAGFPGAVETTIFDYARTAWQKVWRGKSVIYETTAAGGIAVLDIAGAWRSTAAITSITLLPGAGNFAQDTVATLYGS